MNKEHIIRLIKDFCDENQMIIGFTKARGRFQSNGGLKPEEAKSIIVVGYSYNKKFAFQAPIGKFKACSSPQTQQATQQTEQFTQHAEHLIDKTKPHTKRGEFSLIAVGEDYHKLVRRKLEDLATFLSQQVAFDYYITVDTGEHIERDLAVSAGIGLLCRNNNIASERLGSLFNIGLMYTDLVLIEDMEALKDSGFSNDLEIQKDTEVLKASEGTTPSPIHHPRCQSCRACVRACEGLRVVLKETELKAKALSEPDSKEADSSEKPSELSLPAITEEGFVAARCLSAISQKKGQLSEEEKLLLGSRIYGCDECRKVCPLNKDVPYASVVSDIEEAYPDLEGLLKLTKDEYDLRYKERAFHWRGLENLKRNAAIALSNIQRMEEGL